MTNLERYIDDIAIIIQDYGYTRYNDNLFAGFGVDVLEKIDKDNFQLTGRLIDKVSKVKEWLLAEYNPKIKLTQFEYDLLAQIKTKNFKTRAKFCDYGYLVNMKERGYFKNVDIQMEIEDILG